MRVRQGSSSTSLTPSRRGPSTGVLQTQKHVHTRCGPLRVPVLGSGPRDGHDPCCQFVLHVGRHGSLCLCVERRVDGTTVGCLKTVTSVPLSPCHETPGWSTSRSRTLKTEVSPSYVLYGYTSQVSDDDGPGVVTVEWL